MHVDIVDSDLLIIGAGPAGCAAAIMALNAGCRVTIVERKTQPRHQPGETLHPGVEPILRQLGIWEDLVRCGFHRHEGIWRESEDGNRTFSRYGCDDSGPWRGIQVDRVVLNRLLRERVHELGGLIIETNRIELKRDQTELSVIADSLVCRGIVTLDATGRHAWLAGQLGLAPELHEPAQRLWFGWKRSALPELEDQPLFIERSDGWDWLCPLNDSRCSWAMLVRGSGGGIDYTPRIYRECAGKGYMLLGDAAFLLDPSFANGVLRALMSGIYAGVLCAAVHDRRISWSMAEAEYREWIWQFFDTSIEAMRESRATRELRTPARTADASNSINGPVPPKRAKGEAPRSRRMAV